VVEGEDVTEVGVGAAETSVMLENVMVPEIVERESGSVGLGICAQGEVEEECAEGFVDVESVEEGVGGLLSGDVLTGVGEEVVVGERVEHGAGRPDVIWPRRMPFLETGVGRSGNCESGNKKVLHGVDDVMEI